MVADILARILDWKRQEVARARQTLPLAELRQRCETLPATAAFIRRCRPGQIRHHGSLRKSKKPHPQPA